MMASVRGAQRAIHSEEEHGGYDLGEAVMGGLDAGCPSGVSRGQPGVAVLSQLTVMTGEG